MGNSRSVEKIIGEERLQEYIELTYLNKGEIREIFKLLEDAYPGRLEKNLHHRFTKEQVEKVFPQIRHNPFKESIYRVFSSEQDGNLSFEDLLDLCSACSEECPVDVRAAWAFLVYDFDGDNQVSERDLIETVRRLTRTEENRQAGIDTRQAEHVARMILEEMDLAHMGSISPQEFIRLVPRMPDFAHSFRFIV